MASMVFHHDQDLQCFHAPEDTLQTLISAKAVPLRGAIAISRFKTKEQLAGLGGTNRSTRDERFLGSEFWQLHKQDQPL